MTALAKRPDKMTSEELVAAATSNPQWAADTIKALMTTNTQAMPETVFVRRDQEGIVMRTKCTVRLTESSGELCPVGSGKFMVTAKGLNRLNEYAGVHILTPEYVVVDDKKQPNPCVLTDEKTKMPTVVYCRRVAVGHNPVTGSLMAIDVMVRLDVNIYLFEALNSKVKNAGAMGERKIGFHGLIEDRPLDEGGKPEPGWLFKPLTSDGLGLWINYRSEEVKKVMFEHTTRLKFLERIAQSMAVRNALKAHPAIPSSLTMSRDNGTVGHATVHSWVKHFSGESLDKIRTLAEQNKIHEHPDITDVQVISRSTVDDEDVVAAEEELENAVEDERVSGGGPEESGDPKPEAVQPVASGQAAMSTYKRLRAVCGVKASKEILEACGITSIDEATADEYAAFIKKADEALAAKEKEKGS